MRKGSFGSLFCFLNPEVNGDSRGTVYSTYDLNIVAWLRLPTEIALALASKTHSKLFAYANRPLDKHPFF